MIPMWSLVAIILIVAGAALVLFRSANKKRVPDATYVCDVCGERDCVCHEEERG
jgi:hypothetical protein